MADSPAAVAAPGPARPISPWIDRLFRAAPLRPATVGAGVVLLLLVLLLGLEWWLGRVDQLRHGAAPAYVPRNLEIASVIILLLGFFVAAQRSVRLWTQQTFRELRPRVACTDAEWDALYGAIGAARPGAARLAGSVGVGIALLAGPLVDRGVAHYFTYEYWTPESLVHWVTIPFLGWMGGRLLLAYGVEGRRVAALAERIGEIDLFDPSAFGAFARYGLRSALLFLVLIAILSLLLTNQGFGPLIALYGAGCLYFGAQVALRPVRPVHERIVAAKREELARVRAEIRRDRETVAALADGSQAAATRLPGLLAWEQRVESVREWPFDAPMLMRFVLYLVIPLGSWLGGALVERVLGRVLD